MTEIVIHSTNPKNTCLQIVQSGEAFEEFLQSQKATPLKPGLSDVGAYNLRTSTCDILNHCNPHDATSNPETTHLVVGYVQSGKTMSFTGVLAMARDNGYRVAVILTGVTTNLQGQTANRLEGDLSISEDTDRYAFIGNPSAEDANRLIKALRLSDQPLLVIPILKHRKYIDNLAAVFSNEKVKKLLANETVLIIDDEADQASLNSYGYKNSKATSEEEEKQSAIYAAILRLRSTLSGNSYIQYTATPQANILIATMDLLSPKSHTLLIPGEDYVGGKRFFGSAQEGGLFDGNLVKEIPASEVYHKKQNALKSMPSSLREALMMHVWAVLLVIKWYKRPKIKQLSMMVHPTDIIEGNKLFEKWVRDEVDYWSESFDKPEWHEDRVMLFEQFRKLFPQAIQFYPEEGRPTFDDVKNMLPDIVNTCRIYRITGESDDDSDDIKWNSHKMNVLIGAQMLNRGFTVEKLATTYMPRHTTGIANADTIEQRCRFFGYKMSYIESCRVYLPKESIEDYKGYVRHEEELRTLLASCSSLKEYEHRVMLSPKLRPTRANVLPKQMVKSKLSGWKRYERISGMPMVIQNLAAISQFVAQYLPKAGEFAFANYDSKKYHSGEPKKHALLDMTVDEITPLFTDFTAGCYSDIVTKSMTLRYIQYLSEIGHPKVRVIFMSCDKQRSRAVEHESDNLYVINNVFQGPSALTERDNYCGDRNLFDPDEVTIQIHHVVLNGLSVADTPNNETYAMAVHIPEKMQALYYESVAKKYELED